uniref:PRTRC system protein B n=1 Tax=viral metagenome TaxID=1070528 RepID=A0A6M3LYQ0_9ZZZZ
MITKAKNSKRTLQWAIPEELGIPPDTLRLRLDFFHQAVEMTLFEGDAVESRMVSALDVAIVLAGELRFSSGLLPENTLWWQNTSAGPVWAVYEPPKVRKVAILLKVGEPPERLAIPLPGFIFLCSPGKAPWVYGVRKKPTREDDNVYKAPLLNIFGNGRSCGGDNEYPQRVNDTIENFFISFFSRDGEVSGRSQKFPNDVQRLWSYLNGKKHFPMNDMVKHGTVTDLIMMGAAE